MDKKLMVIQRRLERLELEHLRRHSLDLHQRLEDALVAVSRAEESARRADDIAEQWRENFMSLQEYLMESEPDSTIGITRDGAVGVVHS
jgi:hypothetical protein